MKYANQHKIYTMNRGCACPHSVETYQASSESAEAAVWKEILEVKDGACGVLCCSMCGEVHWTAEGNGEIATKTLRS